ncbi:hypothetical protein SAY87_025459 [Trapa incisa]|uniref:Senescence regulator n=1 Tax=Trapa incisa TaxID=236973 RepID=A0AAN7GEH1_9MYRT|nr:hypothetical protein SAY87_025459 [Trapa incisa]
MATRIAYRFVSGDLSSAVPGDSAFEHDESNIYSAAFSSSEPPISRRTERQVKKSSIRRRDPNGSVSSLPVNVPNWSTILRDEHGDRKRRRGDSLENDFDCRDRLPPHEFLARARTASFSVQVGVGRTLKGRDLSRVRNAVWARTGFLD